VARAKIKQNDGVEGTGQCSNCPEGLPGRGYFQGALMTLSGVVEGGALYAFTDKLYFIKPEPYALWTQTFEYWTHESELKRYHEEYRHMWE